VAAGSGQAEDNRTIVSVANQLGGRWKTRCSVIERPSSGFKSQRRPSELRRSFVKLALGDSRDPTNNLVKLMMSPQLAGRNRGDNAMTDSLYSLPLKELADRRKQLAPEVHDAFRVFSEKVFAEGALSSRTKQLIAVAVAHVTQCPYCIRGHTKFAKRQGATREEILEAIWVAAEMRAGGAYAHSLLAIEEMEKVTPR
jgi:AhpD family alkylhydroperoxidase